MRSCGVNENFLGHPITSILRKQLDIHIEKNVKADFSPGTIGVVVALSSELAQDGQKEFFLKRIKNLQLQFRSNAVFLICIDKREPGVDLLSWLNVDVSISTGIRIALSWNFENAASLIFGFSTVSAAQSIHASNIINSSNEDSDPFNPLPTLQRAFSQVPQLLQGHDVLRIANKNRTIADVLQCSEEDCEKIPGLGEKKRRRFISLLRIPFQTSSLRVHDVVQDDTLCVPQSDARAKMQLALQKYIEKEIDCD